MQFCSSSERIVTVRIQKALRDYIGPTGDLVIKSIDNLFELLYYFFGYCLSCSCNLYDNIL